MLLKILLLLLAAWSISCKGESVKGLCDPICNNVLDGVHVPDPYDCTKYYVCFNNEPTPNSIACAAGWFFSQALSNCIPSGGVVVCQPICPPTGGSGMCRLTCDPNGGTINDPFNCSIYHECATGGIVTQLCPASAPFFDASANFNQGDCVVQNSACCVPSCTPYCDVADVRIPDPLDCASYYVCTAVGIPLGDHRMQCDPGENFDLPLGQCSASAKCQTLCPTITISGFDHGNESKP